MDDMEKPIELGADVSALTANDPRPPPLEGFNMSNLLDHISGAFGETVEEVEKKVEEVEEVAQKVVEVVEESLSELVQWWAFHVACSVVLVILIVWILCRCRFRSSPFVHLMRGWFFAVLLPNMITCNVLTFLIDKLQWIGFSFVTTSRWVSNVCHYCFWFQTVLCPQIQVHLPPKDSEEWKLINEIPPRSVICLNHNSFYEIFIFVGLMPRHVVNTCKTLYKATLKKMWFIGNLFDRIGHIPVYFQDENPDSFTVDKEKMEKTNAVLLTAINERNCRISFFPEGVLNKNPKVVQDFRRGSIRLFALEQKMEIYLLTFHGTHDTWPLEDFGGYAADIYVSCKKFELPVLENEENKKEENKKEKEGEEEDKKVQDERRVALVSMKMREEMQIMVDDLVAKSEGKNTNDNNKNNNTEVDEKKNK